MGSMLRVQRESERDRRAQVERSGVAVSAVYARET